MSKNSIEVNGFNLFEYLQPTAPTTAKSAATTKPNDRLTAHHDLNPTLLLLNVVRYDGAFDAMGRFHGYGKLVSNMSYNYEGDFEGGMMHGSGHIEWVDGTSYEGQFVENCITGKGMYVMPSGDTYKGDVVRGQRHGAGQYTHASSGHTYEGDWDNGNKKGKGTMYYSPDMASYYRGMWANNLQNGRGVMVYPSGSVYDGEWVQGQPQGQGSMTMRVDGRVVEEYQGSWMHGKSHGFGSILYITPHVEGTASTSSEKETTINRYDGEFVQGMRHGMGVFLYQDGSKYEGSWVNNMKEGEGKFIHPNGTVSVGTFEGGKLVKSTDVNLGQQQQQQADNATSNTFHSEVALLIEDLLFITGHEEETEKEIQTLISRYSGDLRRIFLHYCTVEVKSHIIPCLSKDSSYQTQTQTQMSVAQFWRLLADCHMFSYDFTIASVDRVIATLRSRALEAARKIVVGSDNKTLTPGQEGSKASGDIHSGTFLLLYRDFIEALIRVSHARYQYIIGTDVTAMVHTCLRDVIILNSCQSSSPMWAYTRAIQAVLPTHQKLLEHVFARCQQSNKEQTSSRRTVEGDSTITLRQFLNLIKESGCADQKDLTLHRVLKMFEKEKMSDLNRIEKRMLCYGGSPGPKGLPSKGSTVSLDASVGPLPMSVRQQPAESPSLGNGESPLKERLWERRLQVEKDARGRHASNITNTLAVDVEIVFAEFVEGLAKVASIKVQAANPVEKFETFVERCLKPLTT